MVDLEQLGQQAQQASYTLGLLSTAQKSSVDRNGNGVNEPSR